MQNKGFIRLFAILLALVSVYYLSFSFVTRKVVLNAEEFAQQKLQNSALQNAEYDQAFYEAKVHYLDSIKNEPVYNFLWMKKFTFAECQHQEINLGLDLKGGMNVTLEVAVPEILVALSGYSENEVFLKAIEQAKLKQRNSERSFIDLFGESFNEIDPGARLANIFAFNLQGKVNLNESTNSQVLTVLKKEVKGAIDNSFNILRTRIDKFGVVQPNIQRLETDGQVLVELPGVRDKERVRNLLQGTANLEFWETYQVSELLDYIAAADEASIAYLNASPENNTVQENTTGEQESETAAQDTSASTEDDLLALVDETTDSMSLDPMQQKSLGSIFLFNTRNFGPSAVLGWAEEKDIPQVEKLLNLPNALAAKPRDLKLMWTIKEENLAGPGQEPFMRMALIAIKATGKNGRAPLDGDVVTDAYHQTNPKNQAYFSVNMSMNSEGSRIWARITRENIGKCVAVVLDGYVYSYPNVNSEIPNGRTEITGNFTAAEAQDLSNVLKSGKMPAPARIIRESVVGPSLGQEAIDNGLTSFIIAFIVILLYMIFYYGAKAGIVADLALICNVFFLMGVLVSFNAVLTLPGIAGIVLTLGMSVDANVLIYERIREELAAGKGLRKAITDGYNNAFSAILDANVTTFLTALVLFLFGTGPIKGFATTLMIGILTSLFSAIFITRLIFEYMLDKKGSISFSSPMTKNWFKNTSIDFLKKSKIAYLISGIVILVGLVSLFTRGLDQGIDFTGGRDYVIRFDDQINTEDVRAALTTAFENNQPSVKAYGQDQRQVKVSTNYMINSEDINAEELVEQKLYQGLKSMLPEGTSFETFVSDHHLVSSEKVGPTIADDIKLDAMLAIFFSLIAIFLYIAARFRNWQFSVGAIVALLHDTLVVLGLFSILYSTVPFSLEINQAFIAAILTVIGYSINDTVVVFDRIREFFKIHPKQNKANLTNEALNSTLSRTFSTSLSTFFVLLAIFIFGGEVIRGFVFALLIGVVVGTYSSLFIATPVAFDTLKKKFSKEEETSKRKK